MAFGRAPLLLLLSFPLSGDAQNDNCALMQLHERQQGGGIRTWRSNAGDAWSNGKWNISSGYDRRGGISGERNNGTHQSSGRSGEKSNADKSDNRSNRAGVTRAGTINSGNNPVGLLANSLLKAKVKKQKVQDPGASAKMCPDLDDMFPKMPTGEGQLEKILKEMGPQSYEYPTKTRLFNTLYHNSTSPFAGLQKVDTRTLEGYHSTAASDRDKITQAIEGTLGGPPKFLIEVGSFVGTGAVKTWGPLLRKSPGGMVLCIDTWEGDVNMRLGEHFQKFMDLRRGFPNLYQHWLDRVTSYGLTDVVFPLAMPSLVAARVLAVANWKVDVVYVDSAHERGETLVEIHLYYNLLRPGGVLLGDDIEIFPAVKHDVEEFCRCTGVTYATVGKNTWMIVKPQGAGVSAASANASAVSALLKDLGTGGKM